MSLFKPNKGTLFIAGFLLGVRSSGLGLRRLRVQGGRFGACFFFVLSFSASQGPKEEQP